MTGQADSSSIVMYNDLVGAHDKDVQEKPGPNLTLIFGTVIRVTLVLWQKVETVRRFAQKHLRDLDPVSAVPRCEQRLCRHAGHQP